MVIDLLVVDIHIGDVDSPARARCDIHPREKLGETALRIIIRGQTPCRRSSFLSLCHDNLPPPKAEGVDRGKSRVVVVLPCKGRGKRNGLTLSVSRRGTVYSLKLKPSKNEKPLPVSPKGLIKLGTVLVIGLPLLPLGCGNT
jgi:hypothetical protein